MSILQTIGTLLTCILLASVAWPLGGNLPYVRTILGVIAGLLILMAIIVRLRATTKPRFSVSWMFLAVGVGYSVLQLVSPGSLAVFSASHPIKNLTASIERSVSAEKSLEFTDQTTKVGIEDEFDAKHPVFQPSPYGTISYLPSASREQLATLSFVSAIFLATSCLLISRRAINAALMTITCTGIAITFFGIVQRLTWNGKVFWSIDAPPGSTPFGPLINRNHAGGFLLVCLSAALSLVAYQYFRWNPKRSPKSDLQLEWDSSQDNASRRWYLKILEWFAAIEPRHLYTYAAITFLSVGVGLTLSRGALLGLGTTLITAVAVLTITNRFIALPLIATMGLGIGFMVWLEQSDLVVERIESLSKLQEAAAPRFQHWQDVMPYLHEHFWLGSGLGTYQYLQAPFQERFFEAIFEHAENVYFETVAELGVIGLVALLGFLTTCTVLSVRLLRRESASDRSVGVAGICCLTGQMVAACFDFGVYLPATGVFLATIMGLVVARSVNDSEGIGRRHQPAQPKKSDYISYSASISVLVGCAALVGFGVHESIGVESLRHATSAIQTYKKSLGSDESQLPIARIALERAQAIRPDDPELDFQWGEYYVGCYQSQNTHDILRLAAAATSESKGSTEPTNGNPLEGFSEQDIWLNTSLTSVHRLFRFAERNNPEMLTEIKSNPHLDLLKDAWQRYLAADQKCSYLPQSQFRLAQLSIFFDLQQEDQHLQLALSRTSPNSQLLFEAGLIALHSGNHPLASRLWRECLTHSQLFEREIVQSGQFELPMRSLFEEVLPSDPAYLLQISKKYFYEGKRTLPNDLLLIHTKRVLKDAEISDHERLFLSAEVERQLENFETAAEFYRLALSLKPEDIDCRMSYANCLQQNKQFDEAVSQLKICELSAGSHLPTVSRRLQEIRTQRLQPLK